MGYLDDIGTEALETSNSKGFGSSSFVEDLCLIHSEVSEVLEEYRVGHQPNESRIENGKPEGIPSELADVIIRVALLSKRYNIDLESAVRDKMAYNKTRPFKHGGKKL